ncbi:hypothetical protein TURU_093168 [Turdus rufiventris]|nr:hypothetical protein TURU_093168 [Turdus rufiventris]
MLKEYPDMSVPRTHININGSVVCIVQVVDEYINLMQDRRLIFISAERINMHDSSDILSSDTLTDHRSMDDDASPIYRQIHQSTE